MEIEDIKGWWDVDFLNNKTKKIDIDHVILDMRGYIMFLVSHDKVYYNFNTVTWLKKAVD